MRRSEALAHESVACLNRALGQLRGIWEEIGIPEDQRLQRTEVVKKHVQGLLDMMIAEEESLKERLLRSIAVCRKELAVLSGELQVPPFEEDEESTILQLEKDLRTRVEVLLKQKQERKQELRALQEQEQDLRDLLCTAPYCSSGSGVPSLEELNHFRCHLTALQAEKERRQAEFLSTKQQIILCMGELQHTPDTSFERDVVCEEEDAFCLSKENLAALKDLLQQLESKKAQNEATCEELRTRIQALWDRLQVPVEEREAFAPHMAGSRAATMTALQLEADRLEELKLQNLRNVVEAVRAELADYWDRCFYSMEQRQSFHPFYTEVFTEQLLQQHDDEVAQLKCYYEAHQELFEAVRKWEENWHLFQELERKATDPSRFTNRGGNLLKEERLRARVQKTLQKLEEELKSQVEQWEKKHAQDFRVNGQPFVAYVAEQWHLYHLEKEREKQERQLKKSRQTEEEMMYGSTPSKRRVLGITTPGRVKKVNITASTPNSTIRSVLGASVFHSPASHPPRSGGKPARAPSHAGPKPPRRGHLERNKENMTQLNGTALSGGCPPTAPTQRTCSVNSIASTYSEFAHALSKPSKSECKSHLNSTQLALMEP